MRLTPTHSLRSAVLALVLVSCTSDRALGPETAPSPGRATVVSLPNAGLVITEVMPDPSKVGDTAGEWFELYNASADTIDLKGLEIVSAAGLTASEKHFIGASVLVAPGEYTVLGNNTTTATNGGVTEAYSYGSSITLNNGSSSSANEWLAIRRVNVGVDSVTLDSVAYAVRVLPNAPGPYTPPSGASRGVIDPTADNTIISGSNWITSTSTYGLGDRGTPGEANFGGAVATVTPRISWVTPGTTFNITASAVDVDGKPSFTTLTWSVDNSAIATINATTGVATGVSTGVAYVTATASNGVSGTAPLFVVNPGDVASISISINDPAQVPAGFTKPAFATTKTTTNATVTPTLVWSSSDAAVATVNDLGYVTGVGAGTAKIRATAPNGVYGEVPFAVIPAVAPTTAVYRNHVEFGTPIPTTPHDGFVLTKPQYVLSYSPTRGGPNWVSWDINATQFSGVPRCDCFSADQSLPADVYHVVDFDYRNGGYDRGHMVQSESRTTTDQENAATFLLTNILPQGAENNQGPWSKFENYLNDLARTSGKEIYVVAGGMYAATPGTLKNEGKVQIPDYTWKVAVIMDGGKGLADVHSTADLQVIAIKMPNLTTTGTAASSVGMRNNPWEQYQVTVDQIEAEAGYDLLANLPNPIEILVESGDRAPVAAVAGPRTGVEGSAIAFDASGSSDPDDDALTYAWDFGDGTTGTGVTPTHTYADNGNYIVTVTVSDPTGAEAVATTTATVGNVAPAIAPFSLGLDPIAVSSPATLTASFTDAGSADTHSALIAWGDNTTSTATVTESAGQGTVSATHSYAQAGVYTVSVTVTDDDLAPATLASTEYVVVYDPSAGFVTGGGWIQSPAGAYAFDPSLAGKATFGFVARYQKGATTPSGSTEFEIREGSFAFTSTSYQWLVVAGTNRAQYKGTGTIAGRPGSYDFLVTALDDASGDRLRVKIWNADGLVYDNQAGASDDASLSTTLGGGSIVVHAR